MRRILYIFIFMLGSSTLTAQNGDYKAYLDSIISNKKIETKFDILLSEYTKNLNSNLKNAAYAALKYRRIAINYGNTKHLAVAYYINSQVKKNQGKIDEALSDMEKSLEYAKLTKHIPAIISCYNALGILYRQKEDFIQAYQYYLKAMKMAEKNPEQGSELSNILNNIANLYALQGKYKEAIKYLKKSLNLHDGKDKLAETINLGINYHQLKRYKDALQYLNQAVDKAEQSGNKISLIASLLNRSDVCRSLKKYDQAIRDNYKAIQYAKELNLKNDMILGYLNLSKIYMDKNQLDSVNFYLNKLERIKTISKNTKKKIALNRSLYYAKKQDYKPAYEFLLQYMNLKDSLQNSEIKLQFEKMKHKYESERKQMIINKLKTNELKKQILLNKREKQIEILKFENQLKANELEKNRLQDSIKRKEILLLNKEKKLQEVRLKNKQKQMEKQKTINRIVIAALSIILFFLVISLLLFYQKIKTQRLLAKQSEKIARQKEKELQHKKKLIYMKAILEGQELERKRFATEMHDGLGGNLAGIKVRLLNIINRNPKFNTSEIQDVIKNLDETCEEVRSISHNLTPPNFKERDFSELLWRYITGIATQNQWQLELSIFQKEKINRLPDFLKIESYRIIQELLQNIHKHASATRLNLQFIHHSDYINILVEDNGSGFDVRKENKGIGLRNIRSRVQQLKGKISIESNDKIGTIINIVLPVKNLEL